MGLLRNETAISVECIIRSGIHEYLDGLQMKMNAIDESLLKDFFAWRGQPQTASAVVQN
jgi:hypothetical protein